MSYKPSDADWMAYLYGELDDNERTMFEQFLASNPEARLQLEKLKEVRKVMAQVEDKEVIAPAIIISDERPSKGLWEMPYVKTLLSMAAAIALLIIVGRLADLHIQYEKNTLVIGFGKTNVQEAPSVTASEVQQMISQSLIKNNESLQSQWISSQKRIEESIQKNIASDSPSDRQLKALAQQAASASKEQIQAYVATVQQQNSKAMKDYLALTSAEQKQYMEDLLVDFAQYLQQQRANDLQLFQARLQHVEQNNEQLKQETEQILTSIISTVSAPADGIKY